MNSKWPKKDLQRKKIKTRIDDLQQKNVRDIKKEINDEQIVIKTKIY